MTRKEWRGLTSFGVILLIFCASFVIGIGAAAAASPSASINPTATIGLSQSDTFTVTVEVDSDAHDLRGVNMDLIYDSSALEVNSITEGDLLASYQTAPNSEDDGAGTISYAIASNAGTYSPESGTFLIIEFQVKAAAAGGTYDLDLDDVVLRNGDNAVIPGVAVTDGTATVGSVASAARTLPASVERGEQFTVSMDVSDYGTNGSVVETIPESFTYVNSTLDASNVTVDNNTITFMLWGETNFEYDVTASNTEGTYPFSGMLTDESANEVVVSGDTSIDVVLPDGVILLPGWNFISVPKELADPNVSSVLTGVDYDALVYYNADTRVWEAVVSTSTFEPFKGYWINVSATEQVILEDSLAAKQVDGVKWIPPSVQLYKGWNAVGSNYESAESAEIVLFTVDDSYSKIVDKSGETGLNGKYEEEAYGTEHFMMNPYEGYWVFVTQNVELA